MSSKGDAVSMSDVHLNVLENLVGQEIFLTLRIWDIVEKSPSVGGGVTLIPRLSLFAYVMI